MISASALSFFAFPTRIVFGARALGELSGEIKRLGMSRPLLVTDRGGVACGLAGRVQEAGAQAGISLPLFDGVSPNPTEENVAAGLGQYRREHCDGIVALGGGSPLDAGKAIRLRVTHNLPLEQYDDLLNGSEKARRG